MGGGGIKPLEGETHPAGLYADKPLLVGLKLVTLDQEPESLTTKAASDPLLNQTVHASSDFS